MCLCLRRGRCRCGLGRTCRSSCIPNVRQHRLNGAFEGLVGGVDVDGVLGGGEAADDAVLVALVAFDDLAEHIGEFGGDALGGELRNTAAGAFFGVGVEIELIASIGEND